MKEFLPILCAVLPIFLLAGAGVLTRRREWLTEEADRGLLRLGVLPVAFLLVAKFAPLPLELKRVLVLQAAMPAAVFPLIITKHYGGDTITAMRVIIGTSAVAIVTIPLWIRFGIKFVGL